MTTVKLINIFSGQDHSLEELQDRKTRARWLGYMIRTRSVYRLALDEYCLTCLDIKEMNSTLEASTSAECLEMPWNKNWRRSFDDSRDHTKYELLQDVQQYLSDPSHVRGWVNTSQTKEGDPYVDVLLTGYGQCSIPRTQMALIQTSRTDPIPHSNHHSKLKSLSIRLRGIDDAFSLLLEREMTIHVKSHNRG